MKITIDGLQNICGVSVVGQDFEKFRKFNLMEINRPEPKRPPPASADEIKPGGEVIPEAGAKSPGEDKLEER